MDNNLDMGTEHDPEVLEGDQHLQGDDIMPESLRSTSVAIDDLFDVLARPANRYALTFLLQADDHVYSHELVEYIIEQTDPPEGLSEAEYRGQINARLLHASLPKLADIGLIDFDERRQRITETEETSVALPYLRIALVQQADHE
jgi:hypothetical protein